MFCSQINSFAAAYHSPQLYKSHHVTAHTSGGLQQRVGSRLSAAVAHVNTASTAYISDGLSYELQISSVYFRDRQADGSHGLTAEEVRLIFQKKERDGTKGFYSLTVQNDRNTSGLMGILMNTKDCFRAPISH